MCVAFGATARGNCLFQGTLDPAPVLHVISSKRLNYTDHSYPVNDFGEDRPPPHFSGDAFCTLPMLLAALSWITALPFIVLDAFVRFSTLKRSASFIAGVDTAISSTDRLFLLNFLTYFFACFAINSNLMICNRNVQTYSYKVYCQIFLSSFNGRLVGHLFDCFGDFCRSKRQRSLRTLSDEQHVCEHWSALRRTLLLWMGAHFRVVICK